MHCWLWSGLRSGKTTGEGGFCLRPLWGVTSVSRLGLLKGRCFVSTSAADGVGKRVAAQVFLVRVFDPILGPGGNVSNARVLARLRRDASRKKTLAAVHLPPTATWVPVEAPATASLTRRGRTEAARDSQAREPNTITKSPLRLARCLALLEVP